MKKNYFYLAACAMALTACTSESVLEDEILDRKEIGFQNVVQRLTRDGDVKDLTSKDLSHFQVYGYYTLPGNDDIANDVFNDVTVTRDITNKWSYSTMKRYWIPGAKYYFYAYSCGDEYKLEEDYGVFSFNMREGLTPQQRVLKLTGYICDNTHQHDLIFASNTGATQANPFAGILGKETDNDLVAFQFKHILSKVNAKFTSQFPAEYDITISDVTIKNIRDRGDYNPLTGWNNVVRRSGSLHFVYLLDTEKTITTSAEEAPVFSNSAYVIPYKYNGTKTKDDWSGEETNTYVSLEFTVNITYNGEDIYSKKIVGEFNPEWKAGYTYTYNINIDGDATGLQLISFTTATDEYGKIVSDWNSEGAITFRFEIKDWEDGGGGTIVVPGRNKNRN